MGYDGQWYQIIAHDPLLRLHYDRYIDLPRLRYRRILTPGLAYLIAAGRQPYIDAALFVVCWLFVGLGTYCLAELAVDAGRTPLWGLLFLIIPPTLSAIDRMTVDLAICALIPATILAARSQRWGLLWLTLAATALSRETGVLVTMATLLWLLRQRKIRLAAILSSSILPALLWFAFLQTHTAGDYGASSLGFIKPFFVSFAGPLGETAFVRIWRIGTMASVLAFLWCAIRSVVLAIRDRFHDFSLILSFLFAALLLLFQMSIIWEEPNGFTRIHGPLLACLIPATFRRGFLHTLIAFSFATFPMLLQLQQNLTAPLYHVRPESQLFFTPVPPCRVLDTRIARGATQTIGIATNPCQVPGSALAYSLNLTATPREPLGYLSVWPTGMAQPPVSTLNSPYGHVVSNSALVARGKQGSVSVFSSDATDLAVDVNGFFATNATPGGLAFYPVATCRIADTRAPDNTFGGPFHRAGAIRNYPIPSSVCQIPATAQAYAFNFTVLPRERLDSAMIWPAGQAPPALSTLTSPDGAAVSQAAIVPAGASGAVTASVSQDADFVLDISGYFAAPGPPGATSFNTITPCRVVDTRSGSGPFAGPALIAGTTREFALPTSDCGIPPGARAYSLNVTVLPHAPLYLTIWPTGQPQPYVSTLISVDARVVANSAIAPAGKNGSISVVATSATDLLIDINGYFAP